jgi:hypothetical protein
LRGKRASAQKARRANGTIVATIMEKYILGWILGVPAFALVIMYMLFH